MKITKNVNIELNESEVSKIIEKHITDTTEYDVKPDDVSFCLGNESYEFGGQPTPYFKSAEINVKI